MSAPEPSQIELRPRPSRRGLLRTIVAGAVALPALLRRRRARAESEPVRAKTRWIGHY